jgi:hypothetical protein
MRCEILSLAASLQIDPNLECGETCKTHNKCPLIADDRFFPKAAEIESPPEGKIFDSKELSSDEILVKLNGNGGGAEAPKNILQQIYDASVAGKEDTKDPLL